jgi:hypothetical protein
MQAMKKTNAKTQSSRRKMHIMKLYLTIDNDMTIQHSTSSKPSKFKAQSFNAHAPNCTM